LYFIMQEDVFREYF